MSHPRSGVDEITDYTGFYCLLSCHIALLAFGVDTVLELGKTTSMYIHYENGNGVLRLFIMTVPGQEITLLKFQPFLDSGGKNN